MAGLELILIRTFWLSIDWHSESLGLAEVRFGLPYLKRRVGIG